MVVDRVLDRPRDGDERRLVKDPVRTPEGFEELVQVEDACFDERYGIPVEKGCDSIFPPGGEIVEDQHLVPSVRERFSDMRADEAGPARYDVPRGDLLP
jgi:hypothetical protein